MQLSLGAASWDLGLAQLVAQGVATSHVTARSRNVAAWGAQGCISPRTILHILSPKPKVSLHRVVLCCTACGVESFAYMGVSKNRGTPKWMVYNGKPY